MRLALWLMFVALSMVLPVLAICVKAVFDTNTTIADQVNEFVGGPGGIALNLVLRSECLFVTGFVILLLLSNNDRDLHRQLLYCSIVLVAHAAVAFYIMYIRYLGGLNRVFFVFPVEGFF